MTDQTNDNQGRHTGAGSRQHEQQTAGGSDEERRNPGGSDPNQSGVGQQPGGSYRPQGDRGVQFEAEQGSDIDFQTDQQEGAPAQQERRDGLEPDTARTPQPGEGGQGAEQTGYGGGQGGIGSQQEQQAATRSKAPGPPVRAPDDRPVAAAGPIASALPGGQGRGSRSAILAPRTRSEARPTPSSARRGPLNRSGCG